MRIVGARRRVHLVETLRSPRRLSWAARRRLRPATFERLQREGLARVGRHTYGTPILKVFSSPDGRRRYGARIEIGSFCSIAGEVVIMNGGGHHTEWVSMAPLDELLTGTQTHADPTSARGDVVIGNDVWLGFGALVLSGVGDGAVVGARAVVTGDVAPYSIVAGNPARPVAERFTPRQIEGLLRLRWWDWPDELVSERRDELMSDDVDGLLARYLPA